MKNLKLTTIALSLLVLSGCSSDTKVVKSSDLVGTWSRCLDLQDGSSINEVYVFTKTTLTKTLKRYGAISCNKDEIYSHIDISYNYTLGANTNYSNGKSASEYDFTATTYTDYMHDGSDIPDIGRTIYSMCNIDDNILHEATSNETDGLFDGSSSEKRMRHFHVEYYSPNYLEKQQ